jgi:glycine/D-amino acid oxidase-like deaminating enzyme
MVAFTGEAEIGFPYWWEALKPLAGPEDCPLPQKADLLVIGAGYTGLSAALAAQECGATVAVVDADRPGAGASTRNGGMFGAHPRLGWARLAAQFGKDAADALFAEAVPARAYVLDLIAREGIDCDLQETGRIQLAWTRSHADSQKRLAADVTAKSDVDVRMLDREDIAREITTERYFGGLLFPDHCAIHPARFHRGLWQAAVAKGVSVTAHAGVTDWSRETGGFVIETTRGRITADKIVLATNGYTPGLFRWHTARVFPLPSYIIATEELPPNLIAHLAPGRRMMVETRARHSYFRISPDGTRILFGGRASMRDVPLDVAARRQHATMCEIWPELRDTKVSHVWTGNTGYAFTEMPHVGEHAGLHFAMGYSGSGTVMAPYLGAKAAYRAMDDTLGETAYARTPFRRHWLHPTGTPHFLRAADLWYRSWVDTRDRYSGR